jgi:hypothetical protein
MRKLIRTTAAAVALAAALVIVPGPASAIGYEDSLDDCGYPQSFDVFVMRPLSFTAMVAGSVFLVGSAPIWAAFDAREAGTIAHSLVGAPAQFAFARGIGECGASSDY